MTTKQNEILLHIQDVINIVLSKEQIELLLIQNLLDDDMFLLYDDRDELIDMLNSFTEII